MEKKVSAQNLGNEAAWAKNQKNTTWHVGVLPLQWYRPWGHQLPWSNWPGRSQGLCFLPVVMAEHLMPESGNLTSFQAPAAIRNERTVVRM